MFAPTPITIPDNLPAGEDEVHMAPILKSVFTPGWVYFIQAQPSGLVKVGFSVNPERRLRQLQTGSPEKLTMLHCWRVASAVQEKATHEAFKGFRVAGEWFKPDAALLGFIELMRNAGIEDEIRKWEEQAREYREHAAELRRYLDIRRHGEATP